MRWIKQGGSILSRKELKIPWILFRKIDGELWGGREETIDPVTILKCFSFQSHFNNNLENNFACFQKIVSIQLKQDSVYVNSL